MAFLKKLTNKMLGKKELIGDSIEEVKRIEEPMRRYR